MDFKKEIEKILKKSINEEFSLEKPPKPEFGDYSLPCFKLSVKPQELIRKIKPNKYIIKIQPMGNYLNFFINKSLLSEKIIKSILNKKNKYGSKNIGKKKKLLIEHTSINPNASPHIGRMRGAFIGDSLTRILKFQNYRPESHFYVNDVGKQIAMLILAFDKNTTFKDLIKKYQEINKKIKSHPELEEKVFELIYKLEKGDKKTQEKFNKVVKTCLNGQKKILNEIGIKFDKFDYESKYLINKETEKVLKKLKKTKKLFKDEFGRFVLDQSNYNLPMKKPFLILTRKDGTSLYPLRDIAYTIEKIKKGKNIIVLGEDQKLYFKQIKCALDLLGYESPKVVHFSFVNIKGEGSMSTRSGNVVLLEDFMKQMIKKAKDEIKKRKKTQISQDLAKKIAYGAIKFSILRISPEKNINFDLKEALSFEGDSAPFIQYAYARINSILENTSIKIQKPNLSILKEKQETQLIEKLGEFPKIIERASTNLQPNILANYSLRLVKAFNEFYDTCHILSSEKEIKKARISLIKATSHVIKNSLDLLGIETPKKM